MIVSFVEDYNKLPDSITQLIVINTKGRLLSKLCGTDAQITQVQEWVKTQHFLELGEVLTFEGYTFVVMCTRTCRCMNSSILYITLFHLSQYLEHKTVNIYITVTEDLICGYPWGVFLCAAESMLKNTKIHIYLSRE